MRTQKEFLNAYAESHQNPLNKLIHYICVPAIFFSSIGILWAIPVGRWIGLEPEVARWVNLATIGALPVAFFYLRLSLTGLANMVGWYALSVALILAIEQAGWPLLAISVVTWIAAWLVQFYGHKVEGAKPSFADDIVFLLIGPLFVMDKVYRNLGRKGL